MTSRTATVTRTTRETSIRVTLDLDGAGKTSIKTGIGFLDHLLDALGRHARVDLTLACEGDLQVDDHHTAEDCAVALGEGLDRALGGRRGLNRFGWARRGRGRRRVDCGRVPASGRDSGRQRRPGDRS